VGPSLLRAALEREADRLEPVDAAEELFEGAPPMSAQITAA
jgi:hypothetical protein